MSIAPYGICNKYADPTPGARAECPGCGGVLIAKCGQINRWHWAHLAGDCDAWAEGETDWHLDWKSRFKNVEVTIKRDDEWHRADAMTESGWVIEFQHSPISPAEIQDREQFYGNMIWIFDAIKARAVDFEDNRRLLLYRGKDNRADENYCTFRWKHPRKCLFYANRLVYLDLGDGWLLRIGKIYSDSPCRGWGNLMTYSEFVQVDA